MASKIASARYLPLSVTTGSVNYSVNISQCAVPLAKPSMRSSYDRQLAHGMPLLLAAVYLCGHVINVLALGLCWSTFSSVGFVRGLKLKSM